MKAFSKTKQSDAARAEPHPRPLPQKVRKLVAGATYEPPKVISFPATGMTNLKPVTMMSNL